MKVLTRLIKVGTVIKKQNLKNFEHIISFFLICRGNARSDETFNYLPARHISIGVYVQRKM